MLVAITREVSPGIVRCELTHLSRTEIDLSLASRQHRRYQDALAESGCRLLALPADPDLPDSVFVEDTAIVLDEIAILTRLGVESRRPEVAGVAPLLRQYRGLASIAPPGTLEGGDVLHLGKTLYVGLSCRTNRSGIDQLARLAAPYGYTVQPVEVVGCLHLKSAVSQVGPDTLLINSQWLDRSAFDGLDFIEVDGSEPYAANALLVGNTVIYPDSFPATLERLKRKGIAVVAVDVAELQKAEGAVTCCSLVFEA